MATITEMNPFDRKEQPKYYAVAKALLGSSPKKEVSAADLREAADGVLSPRSLAVVLRELESKRFTFTRRKTADLGTLYAFHKNTKGTPTKRIAKYSGGDATRSAPSGQTPTKVKATRVKPKRTAKRAPQRSAKDTASALKKKTAKAKATRRPARQAAAKKVQPTKRTPKRAARSAVKRTAKKPSAKSRR
jgi:hypothetical protein